MHNLHNKKQLQIVLIVLIAIVALGIGYASITAINGIISANGNVSATQENFKVYFTNARIKTGTGTALIDNNDNTVASFNITGLTKEGDYAEVEYTILNNSNGINAILDLITTNTNSEYFKVTDDFEKMVLLSGQSITVTLKVEMIKTPISQNETNSITTKISSEPTDNTTIPVESGNQNDGLSNSTNSLFQQLLSTNPKNIKYTYLANQEFIDLNSNYGYPVSGSFFGVPICYGTYKSYKYYIDEISSANLYLYNNNLLPPKTNDSVFIGVYQSTMAVCINKKGNTYCFMHDNNEYDYLTEIFDGNCHDDEFESMDELHHSYSCSGDGLTCTIYTDGDGDVIEKGSIYCNTSTKRCATFADELCYCYS